MSNISNTISRISTHTSDSSSSSRYQYHTSNSAQALFKPSRPPSLVNSITAIVPSLQFPPAVSWGALLWQNPRQICRFSFRRFLRWSTQTHHTADTPIWFPHTNILGNQADDTLLQISRIFKSASRTRHFGSFDRWVREKNSRNLFFLQKNYFLPDKL